MTGASDEEAREFAAAFRAFIHWVHATDAERSPVTELVTAHLGGEHADRSVVSRRLPPFEQANLQTALNAWMAESGRAVVVQGISVPPHHGGANLQQIIAGEGLGFLRLSPPALVDLPDGPGSTVACLQLAILLVSDERGRYVVLVSGPAEHQEPEITVEIAGLAVADAQAVHARFDALRHELNVYRGHLLEVSLTQMGTVHLSFGSVAHTAREDVVLPEEVLARIERHALAVTQHRDALLAAGQHLKRGLLLYGPPGTGKTHTTRYLVNQMEGYTRLLLAGSALNAIGAISDLARALAPAVIVLEDVDLVAEDRSFGRGGTSVLFELLNAMDGAAADADLLFVLTTNRADLLEPALAARPGRVDVAVEIDVPDASARRRLLELYGRGLALDLSEEDLEDAIARTDGVTASFLKELLRRAVLAALMSGAGATTITGVHLGQALDDLLDTNQRLTRSLLGVGNDPESLPPGGGLGSLPPMRRPMVRGRIIG